jgi:hypothetical protein
LNKAIPTTSKAKVLSVSCVVLLLVVFALRFAGLHSRPYDPVYKNKHLSEYLEAVMPPAASGNLNLSILRPAAFADAAEAIQKLGTNSIPLLKAWLNYEPSRWRKKLFNTLLYIQYFNPRLLPERKAVACRLAGFLTTNGAVLLPDLEFCITNNSYTFPPRNLDSHATISYLQILESTAPNKEALVRTLFRLSRVCTGNYRLLPPLLENDPSSSMRQTITLETGTDTEKLAALFYFKNNPIEPQKVIPLLNLSINSSNPSLQVDAALALSSYGWQARPSLPLLSNLLSSPIPEVSRVASNAVTIISQAPSH